MPLISPLMPVPLCGIMFYSFKLLQLSFYEGMASATPKSISELQQKFDRLKYNIIMQCISLSTKPPQLLKQTEIDVVLSTAQTSRLSSMTD